MKKGNIMAEKSTDWHKESMWIGQPGATCVSWQSKVLSSPFFRKVFTLDTVPASVNLKICGLGYYELYINGNKVGDHVLDPVVSHYDKRALYVTYDVSGHLKKGSNVIGVVLGNGWYNCHTPEVWHFDKATWRAYPKFLLLMDINDKCKLSSDDTWKFSAGPIVFDGLRNGETYDARLELDGWLEPDFDDSTWKNAVKASPPGGVLEEQTMPACKVMKTLPSVKQWDVSDETNVYDIGQNMAGWARIFVRGEQGAKVTLLYSDKLDDKGRVDQSTISQHVLVAPGEFQTDCYILKGDGIEVWEPRFTYHGFQYVQVNIEGNAKIEKLEGRVVHTAFDKIGKFECSDENVNKLQQCAEWSYIGNFVGIPTDCPHREKNGWTGDAQLAAETGLFNYDAASSYAQWIDSIVEVQRPSGELPGIVPSAGWGYNWGNGPAWDSALILIPWYVYLYAGDDSIIKKHYDAMKKYVDYCTCMADKHIVNFGLADWGHPDLFKNSGRVVDNALTDTGYYYVDASLLAKFAKLTGRAEDHKYYSELATDIKKAFNQCFYQGDGIYGKGEQTAMGCALYQGLVDESEKAAVVEALVYSVENNYEKPDFGILGAKYIPRALAENGQLELAYRILTGENSLWMHWLEQGATTFWENWRGKSSHNHIMFGDISAWFYQYLAGIIPDQDNPGFKKLLIKPYPAKELNRVYAEYRIPAGLLKVNWQKETDKFHLELEVPESTTATVILPDTASEKVGSGHHIFDSDRLC
jgi:alpha-L-rhamnosidase